MSEIPFVEWEANEMWEECKTLRKENAELRQQLTEANAGIESISQHYREWVDGLEKEVAELREELDSANACNTALWALAEERRVALGRLAEERIWCYACGTPMGNIIGGIKHEPNCDYCRLVKEDE